MESQIKGILVSKRGPHLVDFFGYSTKSLPGIELIGLGKTSKQIKEKFIFLTRSRKMKIPMKRYVLCGELAENFKEEDIQYSELPLLLLFWFLAGHIPISSFSDCITSGNVSADGQIGIPKFKDDVFSLLNLDNNSEFQKYKFISKDCYESEIVDNMFFLPIDGLLYGIEGLKYRTIIN